MDFLNMKRRREKKTRQALRASTRATQRYLGTVRQEKGKIIAAAQEAERIGMPSQRSFAKDCLRTLLGFERQAQAMTLRLSMAQSMIGMTQASSEFVRGLGVVGEQLTSTIKKVRTGASTEDLIAGMDAVGDMMSELDDMIAANDEATTSLAGSVDIDNDELERLIAGNSEIDLDARGASLLDEIDALSARR